MANGKEDCYKLVKYVNDNWTKVWEYWINYTAHDSKEFKPLESAPGDGSLEKLFDSIGDEVFKILFIQDEEVTVAMQKDLKEKFGNKFRFDTSWPNGLEIQRVDSGKGIAVEYLKKHFNQHIHTTIGVETRKMTFRCCRIVTLVMQLAMPRRMLKVGRQSYCSKH